ncbi:MAG: IclR family transcriptional regulator [Pseudomonadota bacterium]
MPTPLNSSLVKGFEILSLYTRSRPELCAADLVAQLGLNKATAHRFLVTLEAVGAVRSTKRGYFALGPKIDELGQTSADTGAIAVLAQPELRALADTLNESVMLCRLGKGGPTCVAVANSTQAISVNITVGTVLPVHASAQGKLWLAEMDPRTRAARLDAAGVLAAPGAPLDRERLEAELDSVRQQGYATNLGENETDIAAVSVAVRWPDGRMAYSLSVFGLLRRFDTAFRARAKAALDTAAQRIGAFVQ